jgi:hypothetical protein
MQKYTVIILHFTNGHKCNIDVIYDVTRESCVMPPKLGNGFYLTCRVIDSTSKIINW